MRFRTRAVLFAVAGTALILPGCAGAPADGVVDVDVRISVCDQGVCTLAPLPGVTVRIRAGGEIVARGKTDDEGRVSLTPSTTGEGVVQATWGSLSSRAIVDLGDPTSVSLAFTDRAVVTR